MAVTMATVLAPSVYDLFYYLFNISAGAGEGGRFGRRNCAVVGRPTYSDHSRARACCACNRCGIGLFRQFFLSSIISLFYPPPSGRRPDIY